MNPHRLFSRVFNVASATHFKVSDQNCTPVRAYELPVPTLCPPSPMIRNQVTQSRQDIGHIFYSSTPHACLLVHTGASYTDGGIQSFHISCVHTTRQPPHLVVEQSGPQEGLRTAYNACFLHFSIYIVCDKFCNHYILCRCT